MTEHTDTTGMRDWINSGWTIASGYVQGTVFAPPPPRTTATDIEQDALPGADLPSGGFQIMRVEDYEDYIEDVFAAQQAMEEYERIGLEGTIAYSELREKHTGSES